MMANTQINITANGTTTLATVGKYCDRNIDVNVNVAGGGGGESEYVAPEIIVVPAVYHNKITITNSKNATAGGGFFITVDLGVDRAEKVYVLFRGDATSSSTSYCGYMVRGNTELSTDYTKSSFNVPVDDGTVAAVEIAIEERYLDIGFSLASSSYKNYVNNIEARVIKESDWNEVISTYGLTENPTYATWPAEENYRAISCDTIAQVVGGDYFQYETQEEAFPVRRDIIPGYLKTTIDGVETTIPEGVKY